MLLAMIAHEDNIIMPIMYLNVDLMFTCSIWKNGDFFGWAELAFLERLKQRYM
jgi:hypothetical protein